MSALSALTLVTGITILSQEQLSFSGGKKAQTKKYS